MNIVCRICMFFLSIYSGHTSSSLDVPACKVLIIIYCCILLLHNVLYCIVLSSIKYVV